MQRWIVWQCLQLAAARWPASRRDEKLQEWVAELGWLQQQPGSTWAQLRFGWSLAMSPAMPQAIGSPTVAVGPLKPVFALAGALLIAMGFIAAIPLTFWSAVMSLPEWLQFPDYSQPWIPAVTIAGAATVPFWMGKWIGTRMPVAWAHRGRLGDAGSAAMAPVILAAVMAVFLPSSSHPGIITGGQLFPADVLPSLAIWAVLTALVAIAAVKLFAAGRRFLAWGIGVVGSFIALDVGIMVLGWQNAMANGIGSRTAPLWLPASLLSTAPLTQPPLEPWFDETMTQTTFWPARIMLAATVLTLGFGLAASRKMPAIAETPAPAASQSRVRWAGAGFAIAAIAIWAYAVTTLKGPAGPDQSTHHVWSHDLRLAAIFAVVASLWLMLAGRAPLALPTASAVIALLAADIYLFQLDVAGVGPTLMVGGFGLAVVCGAVAVAQFLGRFRSPVSTTRHSHAFMAILTAFAAPAVGRQMLGPSLGISYNIVTFAVIGLLSALAATHTIAARERATRPVVAAALIVAVSALVSFSTIFYIGQYPAGMLAGPFLAMVVTLLIRRGGNIYWQGGLLLFTVVAAQPMFYLSYASGELLAEPVIAYMGYGVSTGRSTIMLGAVAIGCVIASVAAGRVVPVRYSSHVRAVESVTT